MVKAIDAFNYWSTECLHVWLFLGTPETSKEHVLSGTPTLHRLKLHRLYTGISITSIFSVTCTAETSSYLSARCLSTISEKPLKLLNWKLFLASKFKLPVLNKSSETNLQCKLKDKNRVVWPLTVIQGLYIWYMHKYSTRQWQFLTLAVFISCYFRVSQIAKIKKLLSVWQWCIQLCNIIIVPKPTTW